MSRRLFGWAAIAVATGCTLYAPPQLPPAPANSARYYSRIEIASDLDTLFTVYERVHPDLYAVTPRDSIARARAAFVAALPDSARRDEFYLGFARIVALIGDGHTSISGPADETQAYFARGGRVLPVGFELGADDELRVNGSIGGLPQGIRRGDRLTSVNGLDADSLLRVFSLESSGETAYWRLRNSALGFGGYLRLHHIENPFRLVVVDAAGVSQSVDVAGMTQAEIADVNARNRLAAPQQTRDPNYAYRKLADGVGYIDFYSMGGDLKSFRGRLSKTFEQIERDSARALIVDLRRNGGGNSAFGDAMISHFTDKPYRGAAVKEWRASDDYRRFLSSGVNPWISRTGVIYVVPVARRFLRAPAGTNVPFLEDVRPHGTSDPFFRGPVCFLIGRGTFSSAMTTADAIKTYHLATVFGEPTGGLPTAFGEVYSFRLPLTGLVAGVSSARYVRASGDSTDRGPVRPDIEIKRTAEDIRLGRDPVLDRARQQCGAPAPLNP